MAEVFELSWFTNHAQVVPRIDEAELADMQAWTYDHGPISIHRPKISLVGLNANAASKHFSWGIRYRRKVSGKE